MTWYKSGTVAVAPGSNAVIGTGTSFIANSRVGDAFRGPDGEWYEVTNIASNTSLSIAPDYQGAAVTAGAYSLAPMQGYVKDSADALREATKTIAGGVADMQEQVAAATEAAESAGQSKAQATEQAGIATAAADASTDNKDAAQLAAQQSQSSAQASGEAAVRSETARDSIVQSEQAAADSAAAAAESAAHAEEVTQGKAASGNNNDITSLRALTADGFDRIRQGIAPFVGSTASAPGTKGLVPAPSVADRLKVLRGDGTYVALPTGSTWGAITGLISDQVDLQAALNAKLSSSDIGYTYIYPNGGTPSVPYNIPINTRLVIDNPFPGSPVIAQVELYTGGMWGEPGWEGNSGTASNTYGVRSGHLPVSDKIIVQSGATGVLLTGSATGGLLGVISGVVTTLPVRVKVFKFKGVLA